MTIPEWNRLEAGAVIHWHGTADRFVVVKTSGDRGGESPVTHVVWNMAHGYISGTFSTSLNKCYEVKA